MLDFANLPMLPANEARLVDEVRRLPLRHRDIESGTACPATFAKHLVAVLAPVIREAKQLPLVEGRVVWTAAGMATAAAERRFRQVKSEPGEAVRQLTREAGIPAGAWFIHTAQAVGDVVPRLSHLSYWLWVVANDAAPSFTGSRGELLFRSAVQKHVAAARVSVQALAALLDNDEEELDAVAGIRNATEHVRLSWSAMAELAQAFDHRRGEFAMEMRQYLSAFACPQADSNANVVGYDIPYAIGDKVWSGPNAANFVHAPVTDRLLGLVDERYAKMIRSRYDYFTEDERELADSAMTGRTALDWLAERLGITATAIGALTADEAVGRLREMPSKHFELVAALTELAEAWTYWSGAHFGGGVQRHVGHAARHIGEHAAATLPVPCTQGASGHDLAEVTHISDLRRSGVLATKIRRAVRTILPAANDPKINEGSKRNE
jgi:hypothetical protein